MFREDMALQRLSERLSKLPDLRIGLRSLYVGHRAVILIDWSYKYETAPREREFIDSIWV